MTKSIGIDLGTTNSVSAIKKVKTEVLKNSAGDLITPSCVIMKKKKGLFAKEEFIVGKDALEWMKQDPENTIVAVKRLMGRNFQDKEIQNLINNNQVRYRIEPHKKGTENSLAVVIGKTQFTPEEVSSKILEKIRDDAEKSLKEDVEYAVITVPAYFDDKQKHATRDAAALAGIRVQRLLPEPTAAAISYGVDNIKNEDAKTIMIFDLGGGTFDLSVLTISGGQFIEQGKGGDMWLGGEDIDYLVIDYVLAVVAEENNILNLRAFIEKQEDNTKYRFLAELKSKAEKAKIKLSSESEAFVEILGILKDNDGDPVDVDVEITREKFNEIILPVVESTMKLIRKLLSDMNFTPDLIDNVLLVGGSSQIPSVVEAIKKDFGAGKVLQHKNPMLAIAEGAAILSHRLADSYECPKCGCSVSQKDTQCNKCSFDLEKYLIDNSILDIIHSTAHDYYIALENEEKHLLVEKGGPLPIEVTENFKLVHKDQKLVHLKFLNIVNDLETSIGDLWLGIDLDEQQLTERELEKDPLNIIITLNIDESNLIAVSASIKEFPNILISKTISRGKADEKLFLALEKVINEANIKKYTQHISSELLERSLTIIKNINEVINSETGAINEKQFEKVSENIEKARILATEDISSRGTMNYTQIALDSYGSIIPEDIKEELKTRLEYLEDMEKNGNIEDTKKAIADLKQSLDQLGGVNLLMQLDQAADIASDTDEAKFSKFLGVKDDIMKAITNNDQDKAATLLNGIIPEALDMIEDYHMSPGEIHKNITR